MSVVSLFVQVRTTAACAWPVNAFVLGRKAKTDMRISGFEGRDFIQLTNKKCLMLRAVDIEGPMIDCSRQLLRQCVM